MKYNKPLHEVFQLSHIALPLVGLQEPFGTLAQILGRLAIILEELTQKMLRQQKNILTPFSQRWQLNHKSGYPVIEVFSEVSFFYLFLQVFVGGTHEPKVRPYYLRSTKSCKFFCFKHSKELCLCLWT